MEHFGKVFWSDYFNARCVIIKYIDDSHWWFVIENTIVPLEAQAPLSVFLKDESQSESVDATS